MVQHYKSKDLQCYLLNKLFLTMKYIKLFFLFIEKNYDSFQNVFEFLNFILNIYLACCKD